MANYLYAFLISLGAMGLLDAAWLTKIAPAFYRKNIGFILADKPNMVAAIIFYLIFVLGVTLFVVYPGWHDSYSLIKVALLGGLLGLVTYATYDLTNQATLKNWPTIVTVVDIAWGIALTTAVSVVAVVLLRALMKQ